MGNVSHCLELVLQFTNYMNIAVITTHDLNVLMRNLESIYTYTCIKTVSSKQILKTICGYQAFMDGLKDIHTALHTATYGC